MTEAKVPKQAKKMPIAKEEDLSLEDKQLRDTIEHHCVRVLQNDLGSLQKLIDIIKSATKTMTSVPKPFKFLKTHYEGLVTHFQSVGQCAQKKLYAVLLSVLSMIFGAKGARLSLFYLLKSGSYDFTSWGHEYVANLANDIGKQYELRVVNSQPYNELLQLVQEIVPYFITNNAQHDAIDLLLTVDKLENIKQHVQESNFDKVNMYLTSICAYSADQEELLTTLNILFELALKLSQYTIALRVAIKLDDHKKVQQVFSECPDQIIRKQLAFNVARQKIFLSELNEQDTKIASNSLLPKFYLQLAKDLEVQDPKHPKDVFKVHLEDNYKGGGGDSKAISLQNIYVNAFVNAGLTRDTLMVDDEEEGSEKKSWVLLLKDKQQWQIAAVASLGIIAPWNSDTINDLLIPYIDNDGKYVRAGASLGIGLCSGGINDENDLAFGLLSDSAQQGPAIVKQCSIIGLGIAYAGRSKLQLQEIFIPVIVDTSLTLEQSAFAALALGLSFVGQCNQEVASAIIQTLAERTNQQLNSHFAKFFGLGLALLFMGQQNKCQITLQTLEMIEHPIKKFIQIMLISTAYVGSGNVLKVQDMMHECLSQGKYSEVGVLGLAFIASSEDIGNEMALRLINHILHFGGSQKKKVIPLALAMLSLSNPRISVVDLLSKLAYDTDTDVAERAIIALGLVGAGTNNSRLADGFRKLASYYGKEADTLFCIRMAQGLLYMGKGMLSIQPYYSEKFLLSKVAMSGVLVFLTSLLDMKSTFLGKHHYLVYFLGLAMYPKSLFVLNEKLQQMSLNIRVGQAVDVVGQAGNPKKITGFQTHTAPVLIGHGQRAQLSNEQYMPVQECVLENFVILKKNPNYIEEQRPRKKTSL